MLRVGLTGDLGSGKSTVARLLAARGAHVYSSDEIGRALMQPGQPVFQAIVEHFGPTVVRADGTLDRAGLARLAFDPTHPRVEELNAIVHPAVIAEQARVLAELARREPDTIAVVESALIFSTTHAGAGGWRTRFDAVLIVTASDDTKVRRFVERQAPASPEQQEALAAEARRRLAVQSGNGEHAEACLIVPNDGTLADLETAVDAVWAQLLALRDERTREGNFIPNTDSAMRK